MGELTIADEGLVSVNAGAGTAYVAFNAGSVGTLNIGAASTDPAVAPGSLSAALVQFGDGLGNYGTGAINFNHTATDYQFDPDIAGMGALNFYTGFAFGDCG